MGYVPAPVAFLAGVADSEQRIPPPRYLKSGVGFGVGCSGRRLRLVYTYTKGRGSPAPPRAGLEPARDGAMRSYTGPPIKASTLARSRGFHEGLPISLAHWLALSSPRTS
jgi:hypothetical protein